MGVKGDKLTKDSVEMTRLLVTKLESIGNISSKRMFGGHGVFHEGKMFGIVDSSGQIFLKAGDSNREMFEAKGSKRHFKMPYYSVPDEILNDHDQLLSWAGKSIEISK